MKGTDPIFKIAAVLMFAAAVPLPSLSQPAANGFYNNQLPGAQGVVEDESFPSDKDDKKKAVKANSAPGGDYTDDEKRMQRKFKGRVSHDKDQVSKGEHMMKSPPNSKEYKKGKIIKEIAEKDLAECEANNPFPALDKQGRVILKDTKADSKTSAPKKEL